MEFRLPQSPFNQSRHRPRLASILLLAFIPLQLAAMHWPLPELPAGIPTIWDKVPHFVFYAVFASLLVWYIVPQRRAQGRSNAEGLARRLVMAFICVAAYAWIDELTQPWTGRTFDIYDWLTDILGAATVLVAAYVWRRMRQVESAPVAATDWSPS